MATLRCLLLLPLALCVPVRAAAEPTARFGDVRPSTAESPSPQHSEPTPKPPDPPAPQHAPPAPRHAPAPPQQQHGVDPPSHSWARGSIAELMRRGRSDERQGEAIRAMTEYTRAIQLDPTYGAAILRLARLRQAAGELREAERLCTTAVRLREYHTQALVQRAHLYRDSGRDAEAFRDLRAAVDSDETNTALHRELAGWYARRRMWPAALAEWRRLAALLETRPGSAALGEARLQVKALAELAGPSDPVRAGASERSWVRRALAAMAR